MGPLLVSYRAGTWLIDECQIAFFHDLSYVKKYDHTFFVIIFFVICLTINHLSGILDTTDTSFMQPWILGRSNHLKFIFCDTIHCRIAWYLVCLMFIMLEFLLIQYQSLLQNPGFVHILFFFWPVVPISAWLFMRDIMILIIYIHSSLG